MAKRHGRNGRLYVAIASGGSAEPIVNITDWDMDANQDTVEVTSLGDASKTFVAGLPGGSGTFAGFWDDATAQTYTAATDGVARKFYLYPDLINAATKYWFGTAFFGFKVADAVGGAVTISGNWSAATPVTGNGV